MVGFNDKVPKGSVELGSFWSLSREELPKRLYLELMDIVGVIPLGRACRQWFFPFDFIVDGLGGLLLLDFWFGRLFWLFMNIFRIVVLFRNNGRDL